MIRLIPRDGKFFDLFAELSGTLISGARLLRSILEKPVDLRLQVEQMQAIEHQGDKATHAIITRLNQTFITPFDREDIHRLASSLDDVLDFMNAAANRLVMYKIDQPPLASAELAALIVLQTEELSKGVSLLEKNGAVLKHCEEVNRLEDVADHVSRRAIAPTPPICSAYPHIQNPKSPIAYTMKFIVMVCATFFARVKPVSTNAKPACMNMTRNPARSTHTMLIAILL